MLGPTLGKAAVAAALGLVLLFGSTLVWTAVTHLRFLAFHRLQRLPFPPLGVAGWAAFYAHTLGSVALLYAWGARALFADHLRIPAGGREAPPVVCVHGFHLTGSCMWGHRQTLERRGRATRALFLGLPYRSAEVYARALTRAMASVAEALPAAKIDVVAHSMGGLILRLVLAENPGLAARVRRIVTLGTPHHGTALLHWLRRGPVYATMGRDTPFLAALPTFAESAPAAAVTTVASLHDLVVYPVETAHLDGAQHITLERIGHLSLLTDRSLRERVADLLDGD